MQVGCATCKATPSQRYLGLSTIGVIKDFQPYIDVIKGFQPSLAGMLTLSTLEILTLSILELFPPQWFQKYSVSLYVF